MLDGYDSRGLFTAQDLAAETAEVTRELQELRWEGGDSDPVPEPLMAAVAAAAGQSKTTEGEQDNEEDEDDEAGAPTGKDSEEEEEEPRRVREDKRKAEDEEDEDKAEMVVRDGEDAAWDPLPGYRTTKTAGGGGEAKEVDEKQPETRVDRTGARVDKDEEEDEEEDDKGKLDEVVVDADEAAVTGVQDGDNAPPWVSDSAGAAPAAPAAPADGRRAAGLSDELVADL